MSEIGGLAGMEQDAKEIGRILREQLNMRPMAIASYDINGNYKPAEIQQAPNFSEVSIHQVGGQSMSY